MADQSHAPLPTAGDRPRSEVLIAAAQKSKEGEEIILRFLDALAGAPEIDKRWLSIGRTNIEQGFMAVNRSISPQGRISVPEVDGQ